MLICKLWREISKLRYSTRKKWWMRADYESSIAGFSWRFGVVVIHLLLTTMTQVRILAAAAWVWLHDTHGMSFTLHSQCMVVFPLGFSSTIRRARNCSDSDSDCLIKPRLAWPDVALGDIQHGLIFVFFWRVHVLRILSGTLCSPQCA